MSGPFKLKYNNSAFPFKSPLKGPKTKLNISGGGGGSKTGFGGGGSFTVSKDITPGVNIYAGGSGGGYKSKYGSGGSGSFHGGINVNLLEFFKKKK